MSDAEHEWQPDDPSGRSTTAGPIPRLRITRKRKFEPTTTSTTTTEPTPPLTDHEDSDTELSAGRATISAARARQKRAQAAAGLLQLAAPHQTQTPTTAAASCVDSSSNASSSVPLKRASERLREKTVAYKEIRVEPEDDDDEDDGDDDEDDDEDGPSKRRKKRWPGAGGSPPKKCGETTLGESRSSGGGGATTRGAGDAEGNTTLHGGGIECGGITSGAPLPLLAENLSFLLNRDSVVVTDYAGNIVAASSALSKHLPVFWDHNPTDGEPLQTHLVRVQEWDVPNLVQKHSKDKGSKDDAHRNNTTTTTSTTTTTTTTQSSHNTQVPRDKPDSAPPPPIAQSQLAQFFEATFRELKPAIASANIIDVDVIVPCTAPAGDDLDDAGGGQQSVEWGVHLLGIKLRTHGFFLWFMHSSGSNLDKAAIKAEDPVH